MLGAHFDSWHAVDRRDRQRRRARRAMMEAMRILKQTGVQAAPHGAHRPVDRRGTGPARIARLRARALRRGRAAAAGGGRGGGGGGGGAARGRRRPPAAPSYTPEHAKFAAYFNIDNGTGAIRGVYLQGNDAVAPIFREWMEPFRSIGMTTLTIAQHGRHRPPVVRRRRPAGLPVHPGRGRVQRDDAPHEPGQLRAAAAGRHAAQRDDRGRRSRSWRRTATRSCRASRADAAAGAGGRGGQ